MDIQALKNHGKLLESIGVWNKTSEPFGYINASKKDYIYEFYCLLRILTDLIVSYDITYQEGTGEFRFKFPQAPANKKGKPRFTIVSKTNRAEKYQVCAGTKIRVKYGVSTETPDISFQLIDSPEEPNADHVVIIMDAKNSKVSKGQYNDFQAMVLNLDCKGAVNHKLQFVNLEGLHSNVLISCKGPHSDDIDQLNFHAICQLANFNDQDTYLIFPPER